MPTALVTGITGQDGSYLAEFLLEKGYRVIGMVRRTSTINFDRIRHIQNDVEIVQGDLLDQMSLVDILNEHKPTEVYNLAAQSFVPTSFKQPVLTGEFTALGVTRVLEAIRIVNPRIRFYQASSSEMFGGNGIAAIEHAFGFPVGRCNTSGIKMVTANNYRRFYFSRSYQFVECKTCFLSFPLS